MEYVSGWAYEVSRAGYNAGLYLSLDKAFGLKDIHLRNLVNGYYIRKQIAAGARIS